MKGIVFHFRNRNRTIKLPTIKKPAMTLRDILSRYGIQVFFVLLFILGLIVGAACSRSFDSNLYDRLDFLFVTNIKSRLKMSAFDIFLSCFVSYFLFTFCAFIFALSLWGFAAAPILSAFKGFSVGLSSAFIFSLYKASGIGFYILVILPGTVLFLFLLVAYSRDAFALSLRYMRLSLFGYEKVPYLKRHIKAFLKKSLFAFMTSGACAVLDMLLWVLFANKFDFS